MLQLFYEFLFYTDEFWEGNRPPQLVWSTGDDTGFGFHGDFLAGWDEKVVSYSKVPGQTPFSNSLTTDYSFFGIDSQLQQAIDQCDFTHTHPYTGINNCPPLRPHLSFPPGATELQNMAAMAKIKKCNMRVSPPKETVVGTISYLRGSPKKYGYRKV